MDLALLHLPLKRGERLGDPADGAALPQRQALVLIRILFERKLQHGPLLGLGFEDHPGELPDDGIQPLRCICRRILRKHRLPGSFRMGGCQQFPLAGEIPVGRAAGHPGQEGSIVHGGRSPGGNKLPGRRNERIQGAPLLAGPADVCIMYILAGEILMNMDGVEHRVAAGGVTIAPRGVPHAFKVLQEGTRVLCLHTPGGAQAFYFGASEPLAPGQETGVVDFERIRESGRVNGGVEILGPPPFG